MSAGRRVTAALGALLVLGIVISLGLGRMAIPPLRVVQVICSPLRTPPVPVSLAEWSVVTVVRLPRVLMAVLAGGGLSLAGACLQGVFRNPLIGPQVVGVSAGAAFGGTVAILLGWTGAALMGGAFALGIGALAMTWALASVIARADRLVLVLAGMIVSGLFGALVSLVQFVADSQDQLPAMVFWLLGSLATATAAKAAMLAACVLPGGLVLLALRWRINILSLGDDDAAMLGVSVRGLRWSVLGITALIVAGQVAVSGMIGWVGLVVPHLARLLVGPDHRVLLPASALLGGLFLLVVDDVARTLSATEIPLGILTALIGTPVFAILLWRSRQDARYD